MPPETIKDAMKLGLDVPQYFVIPRRLFDTQIGINVAEFEFPAYFNFFIKRRKTILICSAEVEQRIREVFRETLLGPENFDSLSNDFAVSFPEDDRPDLRRECDHFSRNPFDRSQVMSVRFSFDLIGCGCSENVRMKFDFPAKMMMGHSHPLVGLSLFDFGFHSSGGHAVGVHPL